MTQYWPLSGMARQGAIRERLIVSLDMTERREALRMVERLGRIVGIFKVGRGLFLGSGPDLVREIRNRGAEVFLDLKFHDNSRNAIRAALEATRLGAKMFDIHPVSPEAMSRMRLEVARLCRAEGIRRPQILAVTMLAGLPAHSDSTVSHSCADRVIDLARASAGAGLDGVFTSMPEVQRVREAGGRKFMIVTCGVRICCDDRTNLGVSGAANAIRAGADYIVIGSRVIGDNDPPRAVRELSDGIERALRSGQPPQERGIPSLRPLS